MCETCGGHYIWCGTILVCEEKWLVGENDGDLGGTDGFGGYTFELFERKGNDKFWLISRLLPSLNLLRKAESCT